MVIRRADESTVTIEGAAAARGDAAVTVSGTGTRAVTAPEGPEDSSAEGLAEPAATGELEGSVRVSGRMPVPGEERYEVGPLLGSGGMGEVTLQKDRNIGRSVARKTLRASLGGEVAAARFLREARVQGQLEHPAVVPVHDFGVDPDGRLFFTMKRIRGTTLHEILDLLRREDRATRERFTRHKLLSAFVQVCLAVEYAHRRGVIHRDLKPANVMLGDFGEVYVLDWGLAKLRDMPDEEAAAAPPSASEVVPEMTSDGDFLGTPRYMAPEQLLGMHSTLDARADVFALGAMLFEILTLEPYRRGKTVADIVAEALSGRPVERPSRRSPDVPAELDALCARALATEPGARPGSARAVAAALERYLEGDRDLAARRAQAAELVASVERRIAGPDRVRERVAATREALKALALTPDDRGAQKLLVSLMMAGSGELTPEAERAFEARDNEVRRRGVRRGVMAYLSWLGVLPLAVWIGVRDWTIPLAMTALTLISVGYSVFLLRRGSFRPYQGMVLAALSAVTVALSTGWLGPFVLSPLAASVTGTWFLIHTTRAEAPRLIAVWTLAVLAPFAVEWMHLMPPAYSFENGNLVLHARTLLLPEGLTLAALLYTSVSFMVVNGYFLAVLRGQQCDAERKLFDQAWLLGRLFPTE